MKTVRVSSKGQIVIPKRLCAALHIEAGSELTVSTEGDEIPLRQVEHRFPRAEIAAGLRGEPVANLIPSGSAESLDAHAAVAAARL